MALILSFFVAHWLSSVFCQSFFLHRYGAHRQFTMSKRWERCFHLLTYLSQGPSYLSPRGYAVLHRMHHAFSDSPHDPHSPRFRRHVFELMWATKRRYDDIVHGRVPPEPRFDGGYPAWPLLERLRQSWLVCVAWIAAYAAFYAKFAPSAWWFLLLPVHVLMGPTHGAIVNW